jgi:CheY-like chemotaxis protein
MINDRGEINHDVTVFVADDDKQYLQLFGLACSEFGLNDIMLSAGEADFLKSISARSSSLDKAVFFLDIRMERKDSGLQLAKSLKQNPFLKLFPTIVMSSSMLQSDINQAMGTGANGCFYKPAGAVERVSVIKQHLNYWTNYCLLGSLKFGSERAYIEKNPDQSLSSSRINANLHSIDLLRRDVIVSLLRDLDRLSAINIPLYTKDVLIRTIKRLSELFEFRKHEFGDETYLEVVNLSNQLKKWINIGDYVHINDEESINRCLDQRRLLMSDIKRTRIRLSNLLKNAITSQKDDLLDYKTKDLSRLSFLIWDIFFEISKDPNFKDLYRSIRRFENSVLKR